MIFYGTKAVNVQNDYIPNVDCPGCSTNVSMKYSIFEKYMHIYWIPFFPIKKLFFAECNSCKKTFEKKDLPRPVQQKLERTKTKTPLWMFSGAALTGCIILFAFYSSAQNVKNKATYIESPKIGDVYVIDASEGFYSTLKLDEISKDSLTMLINDMEIDKKTGTDKIDLDKNYHNKRQIAKKELQKLYSENKIYEVIRH